MRLAVLQSPGALQGVAARLEWLDQALGEIRADLALLPELFACGYRIGDGVRARAEPRDGAIAQRMAALARRHGIALHYGYAEAGGDVIYNAAQCLGADGAVLGHQRKLAFPPGWERDHFAPGRGAQLFICAGLRIANLICYDAEFPEAVRHVALQGAQLVLVPTALGAEWDWVATRMIPTRAYENGVFLAYANHAGAEGDMCYLGASVICAPDGRELARAGNTPDVLIADLDPGLVTAARARLPYLRDCASLRLAGSAKPD